MSNCAHHISLANPTTWAEMPVPALEQLEKEISSLLSNLTNMKMEGGLIGKQNISMFIFCLHFRI